MKNKLYDLLSGLKIKRLQSGKKALDRLMLSVIEDYYKMQSLGISHNNAIEKIISTYFDDNKKAAQCRKFVFNIKTKTDRNFEEKFGKKASYLSQLNKLIQKIYRDKYSYYKTDDELKDLNDIADKMDKSFNKITLYMFKKYPI